jgi:hypothetical protein
MAINAHFLPRIPYEKLIRKMKVVYDSLDGMQLTVAPSGWQFIITTNQS